VSNSLTDQVALVTGASRGIGAGVARKLSSQGASVVLAARSREALAEVAAEIEDAGGAVLQVPTDVSDPQSMDELLAKTEERFGGLHILINNAGILPDAKRQERLTMEDWQSTLNVNLTLPGICRLAPFRCSSNREDRSSTSRARRLTIRPSASAPTASPNQLC